MDYNMNELFPILQYGNFYDYFYYDMYINRKYYSIKRAQ